MKLIIGLGNPGEKYSNTRHNLGFRVVDELVKSEKGRGQKWEKKDKFKSEILQLDSSFLLVKPQTFMNQSGLAVRSLADYYHVNPEDIVVIHDDLDLLLGKIKVRLGGSAGGHHGIESLIKELGTEQFIRIRLGIGNERSHRGEHSRVSFEAEKFVVDNFLAKETSEVKQMIKQAVGVINLLLDEGLEVAQNQFN